MVYFLQTVMSYRAAWLCAVQILVTYLHKWNIWCRIACFADCST